jgi:hypothetical protein
LHDKRTPRRPLHALDVERLAKDIGPGQSAILRTASGELIGVVMKDFCPDEGALEWSNGVVKKTVDDRQNIRVGTSFLYAAW